MDANYVKRSIVTWGFCIGNLTLAILMLLGVFIALPVRWWMVDLPTIALAALLGISAIGLTIESPWRLPLLRISASVCLALGMLAAMAIGLSAAFLSGTHGNLGRSGALVMALVIALLFPYLFIYPSAQLLWIYLNDAKNSRHSNREAS